MFKKIIKLFVLSVFTFEASGQTLKIATTDTIQVIVFRESKMIYNHIMLPTDELILDKSKPILIQWKKPNWTPTGCSNEFVRLNEYGYLELLFDSRLEQRIRPWWNPFGITFIKLVANISYHKA